jgi:acetyltransferase-like isoleucine patch superfamily enzyme
VFRYRLHRGVSIGDRVYLGHGVIVEVLPGAELRIGAHSKIMHYTLVSAADEVSIGEWTQIAEHCSIRDANHGTAPDELIMAQPSAATPLHIGRDVWIARGCAVLAGATVGDGAVVGANSVVNREVKPATVVAGVPVRVIRDREPTKRSEGLCD